MSDYEWLIQNGVDAATLTGMDDRSLTELRRKIENHRRNYNSYFRPASVATAD